MTIELGTDRLLVQRSGPSALNQELPTTGPWSPEKAVPWSSSGSQNQWNVYCPKAKMTPLDGGVVWAIPTLGIPWEYLKGDGTSGWGAAVGCAPTV